MNANRKADLQRKLGLAPVPKPPVGLAERIKREIPKQLGFDADQERRRLSQSVAFNMRVAASILLLVGSAYLALQLLTRIDQQEQPAAIPATRRAPAIAAERPASPAPLPRLVKNKPKRQVLIAEAKEEKQREDVAPPPAAVEGLGAAQAAKVRGVALNGIELRDQDKSLDRFARAEPVPASEVRLEQEITPSPVSGKVMLRVSVDSGAEISARNLEIAGARRVVAGSVTSVYEMEAPSATIRVRYQQDGAEKAIERNVQDVVAWGAASRRTKAAVLAAEWARGGDPRAIVRAAREAGLDELADAVEKNLR